MRRRETSIATFLVFAAVGTGAWAFAASGLLPDLMTVAVYAVAAAVAGTAAGILCTGLFVPVSRWAETPVCLSRYAAGAGVCLVLTLMAVFLLPLLEYVEPGAVPVTLCGLGFLGFMYGGLCWGTSARFLDAGKGRPAASALLGLLTGPPVALIAGPQNLPHVLLGCALVAAVGSVIYGYRFRREQRKASSHLRNALRTVFAVLLCAGGAVTAHHLEPLVRRMKQMAHEEGADVSPYYRHGFEALRPYFQSLRENVLEPSKVILIILGAAIVLYLVIFFMGLLSQRLRARHYAVRHVLVSLFMLFLFAVMLFFSIGRPHFSGHYDWIRRHWSFQQVSAGPDLSGYGPCGPYPSTGRRAACMGGDLPAPRKSVKNQILRTHPWEGH